MPTPTKGQVVGRGIRGRFVRFVAIAIVAIVGTVTGGIQQAFAAELSGVITSVSVREGTVGVWDTCLLYTSRCV